MTDVVTCTYRGGSRDGQTIEVELNRPDALSTFVHRDPASGDEWYRLAEGATGVLRFWFVLRDPSWPKPHH